MDTDRFDAVARLFATRRSRRTALRGGALGLASATLGALGARVGAQEVAPAGTPQVTTSTEPHPSADAARTEPDLLFVQPFASGTWAPKDGEEGVYALTLAGAAAQTVYFSDRPERIFGLARTQDFLADLSFTPDDPPNAALVARDDGGEQDALVVELFNPVYDAAASILSYDARVLADFGEPSLAHAARQQADYMAPERFAAGGLFIDAPFCPRVDGECYKVTNGQVTILGAMKIDICFAADRVPMCQPCDKDGRSAHYGQACAQLYPNQCSFGPMYDANGQYIGSQWDCYGRGVGI